MKIDLTLHPGKLLTLVGLLLLGVTGMAAASSPHLFSLSAGIKSKITLPETITHSSDTSLEFSFADIAANIIDADYKYTRPGYYFFSAVFSYFHRDLIKRPLTYTENRGQNYSFSREGGVRRYLLSLGLAKRLIKYHDTELLIALSGVLVGSFYRADIHPSVVYIHEPEITVNTGVFSP